MKFYQQYEPRVEQKDIIREYQILHMKWDDSDQLPPPFITCLANTEQNLYFYPKDHIEVLNDINMESAIVPAASITGPKNKPIGLKFGKDYLMIKVAFHPTGLYRLLKIPMQKTANSGLNAAYFFPDEIEIVNRSLTQCASYREMIEIVSDFMSTQIEKGVAIKEPIDEVALMMLDPYSKKSLPKWASLACMSLRQFERKFVTRVGLSPKMYIRIVRFENAMKIKNASPEKSWSEIALECEYDDSSHLLREFRQFAEFAPGSLMKKQTSGYGDFPSG